MAESKFKVKDEAVLGLASEALTFRNKSRVAKDKQMLGSFAPQASVHRLTVPRYGWEEDPSGIYSRGSYTLKQTFTDENSVVQAELEMAYDINSECSLNNHNPTLIATTALAPAPTPALAPTPTPTLTLAPKSWCSGLRKAATNASRKQQLRHHNLA
ncbi:hypothetical protein V499_08915 [Pseudogymnoascus sp. VKM F-103]|nr:hypothetical protein V499_08915 [Pseudogymnoascus sp. VKM F-103]